MVKKFKLLSEEYEKALLWFNKVLIERDYKINNLNNIELIIFFNLWIISYYVLRNRESDYAELEKYGYKIMNFIEFIKDFKVIKKKYPHFIYNRLYRNYNDYNFGSDDYEFCHKLLGKTLYDYEYLEIIFKCFGNEVFYSNECNLKNSIVKKYLIKII